MQQPCQRDLCGCRVMGSGDLPQHTEQRARRVEVVRQEERVAPADRSGRPVVPVVLRRQETLGQRTPGDHESVVVPGVRQQFGLRVAVDQAVAHLVAQHPPAQSRLGGAPTAQRVVADPHVGHHPAVLQRPHPAHDHRVRNDRIRLMHLVKVDQIDAQPPRTRAPMTLDELGHRIQGEVLGRNVGLLAPPLQRCSHDLLAAPEAVSLGRVDQVDPSSRARATIRAASSSA